MHALVVVALCQSILPAADARPSAAVLNLEAKQGVPSDVAELLTANFVASLRATKRFSRIVGAKEIESLIGFEKQRELLACEAQSCIAELAGVLGVDYLITGSLGRLGTIYLFNASLISTRVGEAEGQVSRRITGDEEALLLAIDPIIEDLLKDSKIPLAGGKPVAAAPTPAPAQPRPPPAAPLPSPSSPEPAPAAMTGSPPPAQPGSSSSEKVATAQPVAASPGPANAAPETKPSGSIAGKALMGAGGVGIAAGVAVLLVGMTVAVVGLGLFGSLFANVLQPQVRETPAGRPIITAAYAAGPVGLVVGAVGVLAALVFAAAGVGMIGGGFVLNR